MAAAKVRHWSSFFLNLLCKLLQDTELQATKQGSQSELVVGDNEVSQDQKKCVAELQNRFGNKVKELTNRVKKIARNVSSLQQSVTLFRPVALQQFATQQKIANMEAGLDEIKLRQDVLDVKTTNGILIWKIPDIRRRYRDAVDRRTISLYSPPFYTSPHGYRMCIRTYLNGDGIGNGTHISMFFVIMRSGFDNLLPWPFKQSVCFTLMNQKNPANAIANELMPDPGSSSFTKPVSDMNIASGFPKFAPISILEDSDFTQDNVLFIKCHVDCTGL